MRTTISIDDDVFRAARHLARTGQKTIGQVISELARRGLSPGESKTSPHGLPVFDVPPDAPPITSDVVRRALDD